MALGHGNVSAACSLGGSDVDINDGGAQIEYKDEGREIHEIFEAELGRNDAPCRMSPSSPGATAWLAPPTSERPKHSHQRPSRFAGP